MARHELLSFQDAYSGYNQILMEEEDQEKTTFITHMGMYCYRVMTFMLKNVGAPIRGWSQKCAKINSARPWRFFGVLKKDNGLEWKSGCVQALQELKEYLSSPPLLSKLELGEHLLVYLVVSEVAVSAVVVRESKGTQSPIYYISKILVDAETKYPHLEKLALALVVASRKLGPYFKFHPISVVTTFPLRSILHKPELSGRLAKWDIELSEHNITYQYRTTIKSQVLADFFLDFSAKVMSEAEKEAAQVSLQIENLWVLYTDDTSNASGSRLGLVLEVPTGEVIPQSIRYPNMTNNEAEYEAVITGLRLALKYGAKQLKLCCDFQPVVNHVTGTYQIKEQRLQKYQSEICTLLLNFNECQLDQISRAQNIEADGLAKLAATTRSITIRDKSIVHLLNSSVDQIEVKFVSLIWD
ncbi:uncharacterized protein [Nicotiana tomentosiformis]|uniref:uncharacterized protein n=1 Tax=Nicotiana tomentosiformis TaxID=4098 RepID=UPI00388C46D9